MTSGGALGSGLPQTAVEGLMAVFRRHDDIERVVLYGSRAMGRERPASDIDLCLFAPRMRLDGLLMLAGEIDELMLPWKVDLGLWHLIDNPVLRDHIRRVGVEWPVHAP